MHEDFFGVDPVLVALYRAAHKFRDPMTGKRGLTALAKRMNAHAGTLQNKFNVANLTHFPTIADLEQTMMHTGDLRPLDELCAKFQRIMLPADGCEAEVPAGRRIGEEVDSLFDALVCVDSEHGDVARALRDGFADQHFDADESRRLSQEIREAVRALMLLDRLQRELVQEG